MQPELVIIAAVGASNRVIGSGRELPWHIPEDLKRFKRLTKGHPILMGRRTFESILHQFGGPLPDRRNMVLTSGDNPWSDHAQVEVYPSVEDALASASDEPRIFIGGGARVYEQFLPHADRMELTLVQGHFEGDTFFPPYEHLIGSLYHVADEEPHDGFRFVTFVRREEKP